MTSTISGASMPRPSLRIALLLTLVAAALLLMHWAVREPALAPAATVVAVPAVTGDAASTPVAPPVAAPDPAARPAFVSDMEWQVLQAVAAQHADPKARAGAVGGEPGFQQAAYSLGRIGEAGRRGTAAATGRFAAGGNSRPGTRAGAGPAAGESLAAAVAGGCCRGPRRPRCPLASRAATFAPPAGSRIIRAFIAVTGIAKN